MISNKVYNTTMFPKIPPVVFSSALTSGPREIQFTPPSPDPPYVKNYYSQFTSGTGAGAGAGAEGLDTISFLGNVGIGTSTPQYRLDVQNGSARFSKTRIMPVADAVVAGNILTLRLNPQFGTPTFIYGEFRGTIANQASLYSPTTTTSVRISFKIVSSTSSASASSLGDVSLLGSSVVSVTMPTTTPTTTTIRVTMNSAASWFVSGDLLLVESQNAISQAAWEG